MFDTVSQKLLLQFVQFKPGSGYFEDIPSLVQIESTDHGRSWSTPRAICGHAGGETRASVFPPPCASAVGPGIGIQLQQGAHAGRILFIGHANAGPAGDGTDSVWFSDDHGSSYQRANTSRLQRMDEAQLAELPSGEVVAIMRP